MHGVQSIHNHAHIYNNKFSHVNVKTTNMLFQRRSIYSMRTECNKLDKTTQNSYTHLHSPKSLLHASQPDV